MQGSRLWDLVLTDRATIPEEAPWHPLLGGNTLARGSQGRCFPYYSPRVLSSPGMAPPDARGPLQVLVGIVLGELDSSTPRVSGIDHFISIFLHAVIQTCMCFFFGNRPLEELQDPNRSPGREEVGRRTLRDYGGFLLSFFYRARFDVCRFVKSIPTKK